MKLSLVVVNAGKASGQAIPIKIPQFVIGRDPLCNLRPASAMISKKHCAIIIKGEQVWLRDFGSTNGTFLNEAPVQGDVVLKNDDLLRVGPLTFKVVVEMPAAPSKPTPLPKPAARGSEEDEAAALLLSLEGGSVGPLTADSEEEVPGGSTVMDIPAFVAAAGGRGRQAGQGGREKERRETQARLGVVSRRGADRQDAQGRAKVSIGALRVALGGWVARPESSKGVAFANPRPSKTQGVPPYEFPDIDERSTHRAGARLAAASTAALVRAPCPRPAVAPHARSLRDLGQRGHAAADPGRQRHPVLRTFPKGVSDPVRTGRRAGAGCAAPLGRARLLSTCPQSPPRGAARSRRTRRPTAQ